ncbi:MAG: hypothetical protein OH316_02310 [Candidatus Parvarchaeota archaeon]|nr:hypothetical protein [Candidatus Parvarchaeota archaeon]
MFPVTYNEFHLWWIVFEALNGIFASALSILMVYAIFKERRTKAPIIAWSIDAVRSTKAMNRLVVASFLFVLVFTIYYLGTADANILQAEVLKALAEALGGATYLIVTSVVWSWFKLFRRFI